MGSLRADELNRMACTAAALSDAAEDEPRLMPNPGRIAGAHRRRHPSMWLTLAQRNCTLSTISHSEVLR
jgi:hypothetical protein